MSEKIERRTFIKTVGAVGVAVAGDLSLLADGASDEKQTHLTKIEQINAGSFYTPAKLVDVAFGLIEKRVGACGDFTLIDTSCGYGSFLMRDCFRRRIGADVDPVAVKEAQRRVEGVEFRQADALVEVSRTKYGLADDEPVIVIGNPPYNDTTSIIRHGVKDKSFACDADLRHRDIGMSFLLSYNRLAADYVCVLHPLSYLIKKSNFNSIKAFTANYRLIDGVVVSSGEFADVSKSTAFPIIIALYQRAPDGMTDADIANFRFRTGDGKSFALSQWTSSAGLVQKYPNQNKMNEADAVAKFYTLRDINALKRSKTFMSETIANTVLVLQSQFKYYCYLDVFKDYIGHIPYYLGNCDPMIDLAGFEEIADSFVYYSSVKHAHLPKWKGAPPKSWRANIDGYFKTLLGEHYID